MPVITPTVCKICGHEFPSNPLHSAVIVGTNPQAKTQHLMAMISPLMKHLEKKHPTHLRWSQMTGGEYAGLIAVQYFHCTEEIVANQQDYTRWKIHQLTTRAKVTDERIEERLTTIVRLHFEKLAREYPTTEERESWADISSHTGWMIETEVSAWMKLGLTQAILAMVREMRDVLAERGRYQMQDPPPPMPSNGHPTGNAA